MLVTPICKFPTRVYLIDDDQSFLENIVSTLSRKENTYSLYREPFKALDDLAKEEKDWFKRITSGNSDILSTYEEWGINVKFYELQNEIYNPKRFETVSCMLIDHNMPEINGLELCKKIKNPFVKKALFTGIADEERIIKGFNSGLIDKYIGKSVNLNDLRQIVSFLSSRYFEAVTRNAANIIISNQHEQTVLVEPEFPDLFNSIVQKYNIVEYYLFESMGSYLMLDAKGKAYGFFIYSEEDVEMIADDAHEELGPNSETSRLLVSREKIFCFHSRSLSESSPKFPDTDQRLRYLQKANHFKCTHREYYWAFTDQNIDVDQDRILSFHDYKESLQNH